MAKRKPMILAAEKLKGLRDLKDWMGEQIKEVDADIEVADKELIRRMQENETTSFTHNGTVFSIAKKVRASTIEGMKTELLTALRQNGAGNLIQETVNSNTLSSYIRKLKAENNDQVPEWIHPYVCVVEKMEVSVRAQRA